MNLISFIVILVLSLAIIVLMREIYIFRKTLADERVRLFKRNLAIFQLEQEVMEWRGRFQTARDRNPIHRNEYINEAAASVTLNQLHRIALYESSEEKLRDKILNWKTKHYILKNKGE